MRSLTLFHYLCLLPVIVGSAYCILCLVNMLWFRARAARLYPNSNNALPPVTILKPICGLDKDLHANLRTACLQDYADYQVILSVQRPDDPAIPILMEVQKEFGPELVSVVIDQVRVGANGKINNLVGAMKHARHDILVISDSDVRLSPDYLRTIVAPFCDPEVGYVCTLYRAAGAGRWFEKMELLTLNADFIPNVVFAAMTGANRCCLGSSTAVRRSTLEQIGGLEALANHLAEDYEMGRRILALGKRGILLPYCVETMVDLDSVTQWWHHQLRWDQTIRIINPSGYFGTLFIRSVPFALLFALTGAGPLAGLSFLGAALLIRLSTAAGILELGLQDQDGLKSLAWLPLRDLVGIVVWGLAFTQRTTTWRGSEFVLTLDGRLSAQKAGS